MKLPLILINFKSYTEGTGYNALKLAKICEELSGKYDVTIAIAPQDVDIFRISSQIKIPIFAQSIEPIEPGAHTGHELALAAKEAGAIGTLINHSENRLTLGQIEQSINIAKKNNLKTVVCVPDVEITKIIAKFKPNFIAYEVSGLIGTGKAISKVKPESVRKFVKVLSNIDHKIIPLCGAGISTGEDVKTALELGTQGVIVASAVVKSKNPMALLEDLVRATL
ncbi:MAG: triose-phosphate isomerase [Candidatus Aenigmarchaeota archaeon]|nr:triose-phosphate isomerase [Candidatus Aenigmarchaeota archaeon]